MSDSACSRRHHTSLPQGEPVSPSSASGGGGSSSPDWLPVSVVAYRSGKSRDVIGGLISRGKLRVIKVSSPRHGYKHLIHWPTAEVFLRNYVPSLNWKRKSGTWSGPPSPETIAAFNRTWDRFIRGECEPIGYARPGAGVRGDAA